MGISKSHAFRRLGKRIGTILNEWSLRKEEAIQSGIVNITWYGRQNIAINY